LDEKDLFQKESSLKSLLYTKLSALLDTQTFALETLVLDMQSAELLEQVELRLCKINKHALTWITF
jgi:hypothetical protein